MCTVTYLALDEHSFLLTHNRDEHHSRTIALLPEKKILNETEIIFPKDEQGGGTWIAGNQEFTLCLLNGGYKKHISTPPYRHSRGLVILDFFKFRNVAEFYNNYEFKELEPFTLIIVEHNSLQLHEIVNDSGNMYHSQIDHLQHHMWSSSTLYKEEDRNRRQCWFKQWCFNNPSFTQKEIIEFHLKHHDDDQHEGIRINRQSVLFTVSLSSIYKHENDSVKWIYLDLLQNKTKSLEI